MVYRNISPGIKQRALQLLSDGWDMEDIVDALGVSPKSVDRWLDKYETHGRVDPPSVLRGRRRALNPAILEELQQLIRECPSLFLDEISEWLAIYHDQPIHTSQLHRTLHDIGLTYKRLRKVAAERDEEARNAWLHEVMATYSAVELVFLDESSKDDRTLIRHYGRAASGETPVEVVSFDRGERYSILPALTLDGYIAIRVVPDSVDGAELYDFVLNDVLPKMNPYEPGRQSPRSVLIMDNCNTHKSEALREAVEAAGCKLLFLPPYSPDLNPIEESFSCVKAWLRRHWRRFQDSPFPDIELLEACMAAVTPEKAHGWFKDSGYL